MFRKSLGFTLLELIIATAILLVLSTLAVPLARLTIQREKERQLRGDLWEMRDAIDRYKLLADRGGFQTLVKGVDVQGKTVRFLRKIPIDPMTGTTEWGLRSMPTPIRGVHRTCSMFTRNRKAPPWMIRSIRTGEALLG